MKRQLSEVRIGTVRLLEGERTEKNRFPVQIISQGLGNLVHRNYYSAKAIGGAAALYEGRKAYMDHPGAEESQDRPERSVRDIIGHYENVKVDKDKDGLMAMRADLVVIPHLQDVLAVLEHAIEYKKKHPEKDFIGISINGSGDGREMSYEEFLKEIKPSAIEMKKIQQVEGQTIYVIDQFTDAVSADLVTEAGARGKVLKESNTKNSKRRKYMKFLESIRKLFAAIESGNKDAVKSAQDDLNKLVEAGETSETDEAKAAEAEKAHAEAVSKEFEKAKKETKKEDGETDEAHSARCMAAALKAATKKENDAKDGDGNGSDDEPDDEGGDAGASKEGTKPGNEGKPKESGARVAALTAEIERLKAENAKLQETATTSQTEAAAAKIKTKETERAKSIDKMLQESGLPRRVTDEFRPILAKCKTEKEMKDVVENMKKAFEEAVDQAFITESQGGFPAAQPASAGESNDDCFK